MLMPYTFSDDDIVNTFKELYPHMWDDLNKQYNFWHNKNMVLIKYVKKSRYNFILDCAFHSVNKLRKDKNRIILGKDEVGNLKNEIKQLSKSKFDKRKQKVDGTLRFIQEIEPSYTSFFIPYFSIFPSLSIVKTFNSPPNSTLPSRQYEYSPSFIPLCP